MGIEFVALYDEQSGSQSRPEADLGGSLAKLISINALAVE
jgi:hypothetical protein